MPCGLLSEALCQMISGNIQTRTSVDRRCRWLRCRRGKPHSEVGLEVAGASATRLRSTAGFDTRDLKEAKALLEELSRQNRIRIEFAVSSGVAGAPLKRRLCFAVGIEANSSIGRIL